MTTNSTRRALIAAGLTATPWLISCATGSSAPAIAVGGGADYDFVRRGAGAPSIVLVHGLADDRATWRAVFDPLANLSTTLAFNRSGYGRSAQTDRPRDAMSISDEIRSMLNTLSVPAPYLMVGHSLGGIYAQVFARRFPAETAGLVLVDSTVPGQTRYLRTSVAGQFAVVTAIMGLENAVVRREFQDAETSEDQVERFAPYRAGPVFLLAASEPDPMAPQAFSAWRRAHMRGLADTYGGELRPIRSGHFIQRERPAEVIAAIQAALDRARRT
jgi:pimeloyl-ACP methyl ester carboxylesterase